MNKKDNLTDMRIGIRYSGKTNLNTAKLDTLTSLGYRFEEDDENIGHWIWVSDNWPQGASLPSPVEALDDAWRDAETRTKAILGYLEKEWQDMGFIEQRRLVIETLSCE